MSMFVIFSLIPMNDKSGEPKSDAVIASEIKEPLIIIIFIFHFN